VDQPPGSITKKAVASKKVSREHEHERGGHIQNEKNEGKGGEQPGGCRKREVHGQSGGHVKGREDAREQ